MPFHVVVDVEKMVICNKPMLFGQGGGAAKLGLSFDHTLYMSSPQNIPRQVFQDQHCENKQNASSTLPYIYMRVYISNESFSADSRTHLPRQTALAKLSGLSSVRDLPVTGAIADESQVNYAARDTSA